MYYEESDDDLGTISNDQAELLESACSKLLRAAASAGLDANDLLDLLGTGMTCRDLLDVVASQLNATVH